MLAMKRILQILSLLFFLPMFSYAQVWDQPAGRTNGQMSLGVRNDSGTAMTSTNGDWSPYSVNSKGHQFITTDGTPIPISGSVSTSPSSTPQPVSQSGTWTVQPGNTPNSNPWLVTVNQGGVSANVTGANALKVDIGNLNGSTLSPGQNTMANSLPVVLASNQTSIPVTLNTSTTGGWSTYSAQGGTGNALLTNSAIAIAASAASLGGVDFVNLGGSAAFVQIFNVAAASVVLGTTVPKIVKWVPAGGSWEEKFGDVGIAFSTAISVAATTTTTGSTAPGTGINANIEYK